MARESGDGMLWDIALYIHIFWRSIMFFLCLSGAIVFQILHILVFRTAPETIRILFSHMRE